MKKIIISIVLAIMASLAFVVPVFATVALPTSMTIDSTYAYRNLKESGDMLFLTEYHVNYPAGAYPTELANQTVILRLMDGSTELSNAQPYCYFSNGYQGGVVSFYFSAAQVTALSIVWGNSYTVALTGNPLISWTGGVTPIASPEGITVWYGTSPVITSTSGQRSGLSSRILALGLALGQEWGVCLIAPQGSNNYLSNAQTTSTAGGYGEAYFPFTISYLRDMAPSIFLAQTQAPVFPTSNPGNANQVAVEGQLVGSPLDVTPAATIFGVSRMFVSTIMVLAGCMMFIVFASRKEPGFGRYATLVAAVVVIFGAAAGGASMLLPAIGGLLASFLIAYVIGFEKAGV